MEILPNLPQLRLSEMTDQNALSEGVPVHQLVPPGTKILLIDDSSLQSKTLMKIFRELGYGQVSICLDPFQALPTIKKEDIEIIFCDWNMPGCSGLELLSEMRKDAALRNLPFIMLTANAQKEQVMEAVKSGVSDYVVKPITKETLLEKLTKVGQAKARN